MNNLKSAIKEFQEVQYKYDKYGAGDTEPDQVFQVIISNAFYENSDNIKNDPEWWELYDTVMDCTKVANELTVAANKVAQIILNWSGDRDELEKFIRIYCWRLFDEGLDYDGDIDELLEIE